MSCSPPPFHGTPAKTGLTRGVAPVLKSGGPLAVVNWQALPREQTVVLGEPRGPATKPRLAPEAVRAAVEPVGFDRGRLVELPPYHHGALFRKAGTGLRQNQVEEKIQLHQYTIRQKGKRGRIWGDQANALGWLSRSGSWVTLGAPGTLRRSPR